VNHTCLRLCEDCRFALPTQIMIYHRQVACDHREARRLFYQSLDNKVYTGDEEIFSMAPELKLE